MSLSVPNLVATLEFLMATHKFNIASIPASEVHSRCVEALEIVNPATPPAVVGRLKALEASAMENSGLEGLGGAYQELNSEKLIFAVVNHCQAQLLGMARQYAPGSPAHQALIAAQTNLAQQFGLS